MANNYEQVKLKDFFEDGTTQVDVGKAQILSGHGGKRVFKRLSVATRLYSNGRHKVVYFLNVKGWGTVEHYEMSAALEAYNAA